MTDEVLLVEHDGPVAIVTLNRPAQLNALNAELRAALREAVAALESNLQVRVAILKGAGRGFCAGADLAAGLEFPVSDHIAREYQPALLGISNSRLIWIAQVQGSAAGIGAAFAMNCDLMTMTPDAYLYMAFAAISLIPDGGNTWLLLRRMGYARALQAILEGRRVPAAECLALGIANKVIEPDRIDAETLHWAKGLASGPPLALAAAKRLLRNSGSLTFDEALAMEGREQDPLVESEDFKEGVAAFFAKRKPVFTGR
jgi:2-(1,2-epoxy-1,2-dihydrophenyl)acetyl-CoA isomerase